MNTDLQRIENVRIALERLAGGTVDRVSLDTIHIATYFEICEREQHPALDMPCVVFLRHLLAGVVQVVEEIGDNFEDTNGAYNLAFIRKSLRELTGEETVVIRQAYGKNDHTVLWSYRIPRPAWLSTFSDTVNAIVERHTLIESDVVRLYSVLPAIDPECIAGTLITSILCELAWRDIYNPWENMDIDRVLHLHERSLSRPLPDDVCRNAATHLSRLRGESILTAQLVCHGWRNISMTLI